MHIFLPSIRIRLSIASGSRPISEYYSYRNKPGYLFFLAALDLEGAIYCCKGVSVYVTAMTAADILIHLIPKLDDESSEVLLGHPSGELDALLTIYIYIYNTLNLSRHV